MHWGGPGAVWWGAAWYWEKEGEWRGKKDRKRKQRDPNHKQNRSGWLWATISVYSILQQYIFSPVFFHFFCVCMCACVFFMGSKQKDFLATSNFNATSYFPCVECKNRWEGFWNLMLWNPIQEGITLVVTLTRGSPLYLSCVHAPRSRPGLCGTMPHGVVWVAVCLKSLSMRRHGYLLARFLLQIETLACQPWPFWNSSDVKSVCYLSLMIYTCCYLFVLLLDIWHLV